MPGGKAKAAKKDKVVQVKAIYGARQLDSEDEPTPPTTPSPGPANEPPKAKTKPPVQLLRPAQLSDASVLAAPLVDGRMDVVRDFAPIEKVLREKNTMFRVVAALGRAGSGRSTLLSTMLECTSTKPSIKFNSTNSGVDVFVHADRRIIAVKMPALCSPNGGKDLVSRGLDLTSGVSNYSQLSRVIDVRSAFCALVTSQVVLVIVEEGEALDGPQSPLRVVAAAQTLVRARNLTCAKVVAVRNKTASGFSGLRRIAADEKAAGALLGFEVDPEHPERVVHVPHARNWGGVTAGDPGDEELDAALFRLRRAALADFKRPVRLMRSNGEELDKAGELDWLAVFIQHWGEAKSASFTTTSLAAERKAAASSRG